MSDKKDSHSADGGDLMGLINDTNADLDAVHSLMNDDDGLADESLLALDGELEAAAEDANDAVTVKTPQEAAMIAKQNPDASVMVQASLDTREGRAALRAKLAADALGKEETGEIQDAS